MRHFILAAVLMACSGAASAAPRTGPTASPMVFAMFLDKAPARHLAVRSATILRPTLFHPRLYRT